MATQTKKTDQKIIDSGSTKHLMRFPAEGRRLRVTAAGSGVVASVADELGPSNDAALFSVALRSLRVERAQATDQVIIWSGPL
jgi:hypothetical protein